jgi:restriction system protein
MAIPTYDQLKSYVLQIMKDGEVRSVRDLAELISPKLADKGETLTELQLISRIGWTCTYLRVAGILEKPYRTKHVITDRGRKVFADTKGIVDDAYLQRFPEFATYLQQRNHGITTQVDAELSPEEQLDSAALILQQSLADDLLDKLKTVSPSFFERIVVDLLVAMGYGGSVKDAGKTVGKSGDGGIDGIIKEDKLGLDTIYIQAKRKEANVGRPEVQKFAGALQGVRARKGVFITTSSYSSDALDFVRNIDSKIVLIDGAELSRLMTEYGVGVSVQRVVKVMRLDGDYFEE